MKDEKKIRNLWYKEIFLDKKTKKISIVCERRHECRPAKSIDDFKNEGGDLIHDYESVEWNLKEDENDMPTEEVGVGSTDNWIGAVCDKYNLIAPEQAKEKVRVEWEDGTFTEQNYDEIFIDEDDEKELGAFGASDLDKKE